MNEIKIIEINKSDNILLRRTDDDVVEPVLIDFSLAKLVDPSVIIPGGEHMVPPVADEEDETTHTPSIGTPTYRAPEVVAEEDYGFPSDMWSVGVCLLELLRGKALEVMKDKGVIPLIKDCLADLPHDQPFPNLIRGLLQIDPRRRLTPQQALESSVFHKYRLTVHPKTFKRINIQTALPLDNTPDQDGADGEEQKENAMPAKSNQRRKTGKTKPNQILAKRFQRITKICRYMEWDNPMTAQAALTYSIQMSELCDVDDVREPQGLMDCVVLAHKFFERHLTDLTELGVEYSMFENWDLDEYIDNEGTLFMMMDFCLYPRQYLEV